MGIFTTCPVGDLFGGKYFVAQRENIADMCSIVSGEKSSRRAGSVS